MWSGKSASYAALGGLCVLAMGATGAQAGSLRTGIGVDYTSGEYGGTESIDQTYVPFKLAYRAQRWGLRLTAPYVSVNGPGTLVDSSGELIPGPDETRSGLGDVILGTTLYDVVRNDNARFYLDLGAKMKFGTASKRDGLGTGEDDYSLQADVLKDFARLSVFASAGYKWRGDPDDTDLRNVPFASFGGDYLLTPGTRVGMILDYRESAFSAGESLREAVAYVSFSRNRTLAVQPYLTRGFSDSSPDWGAGLTVGWTIQRRSSHAIKQ